MVYAALLNLALFALAAAGSQLAWPGAALAAAAVFAATEPDVLRRRRNAG